MAWREMRDARLKEQGKSIRLRRGEGLPTSKKKSQQKEKKIGAPSSSTSCAAGTFLGDFDTETKMVSNGNEKETETSCKVRVIAELETGDPDDMLTLAWLAGHPRVELIGVCMVPGTPLQISVAAQVLEQVWGLEKGGKHGTKRKLPPIASVNPDHKTKSGNGCVSPWHTKDRNKGGIGLKRIERKPDMTPEELYALGPDVVITGSPPKGIARAIRGGIMMNEKENNKRIHIPLWVCQGGFAGDSIVPPEHRLNKFAGKEVVATYNLGGARADAEFLFSKHTENALPRIRMVAKNVCHGVVYDKKLHDFLAEKVKGSASLSWIWRAMDVYLKRKPSGKKLHDPLAAIVALEPSICSFSPAVPYNVNGRWGSKFNKKQERFDIAVAVDRELFPKAFAYHKL
mmetsp:Transcript_12190/g.16868  ORF Transcript_12190/g.16868 Transcript_12190/m.16868 type:complete len:400 (-) Transcript_12190:211-1410(-)